MPSIIKGDLSVGRYTYTSCLSDISDNINDIRTYASEGRFVIERCIEFSSIKGGGIWEEISSSLLDGKGVPFTLASWKTENYLTDSPISLHTNKSEAYRDYVLSEGGYIVDYGILGSVINAEEDNFTSVVVDSKVRLSKLSNQIGNIITEFQGTLGYRTVEEILIDIDIPLTYWTTWAYGITTQYGAGIVKVGNTEGDIILGYNYWLAGELGISINKSTIDKLLIGYDESTDTYKIGNTHTIPYVTITPSKLVVNSMESSSSQIRTWYIANPEYADNLLSEPTSHIILHDDSILGFSGVAFEFDNPYVSQGVFHIASNIDIRLNTRVNAKLVTILGIDTTGKVVVRPPASFISDYNILVDPLTTKGDILVHNGTSSIRLVVGSNAQVLVADSTVTAGVKWATIDITNYWSRDINNVVYPTTVGDTIGLNVGGTIYQALSMPNSTSFVLGNGGQSMTGINNTIIGNGAAPSITTGYQNIIAGTDAGNDLTTGYQNVLLGYLAGGNIVSGYGNMAFGTTALWKATGDNNIGIGAGSGFSLVTGDGNIYIGDAAGAATESNMFYVTNIVKAHHGTTDRYFEILNADVVANTFNGVALTRAGLSTKFLAQDGIYYKVDGSSGMINPMTTAGDIIIGGASGTPTRLGATTDGYILSLVSGKPAWVAAAAQSHGNHTGEVTSSGLTTTLDKTAISNRTSLGSLATDDYMLIYDTSGTNIYKVALSTLIKDTPTNNQTAYAISSNWAYDHSNTYGTGSHVPAAPDVITPSEYFLNGAGIWAVPPGGGGSTITYIYELSDVPNYAGAAGLYLRIKSDASGVEYATAPGTATSITSTLYNITGSEFTRGVELYTNRTSGRWYTHATNLPTGKTVRALFDGIIGSTALIIPSSYLGSTPHNIDISSAGIEAPFLSISASTGNIKIGDFDINGYGYNFKVDYRTTSGRAFGFTNDINDIGLIQATDAKIVTIDDNGYIAYRPFSDFGGGTGANTLTGAVTGTGSPIINTSYNETVPINKGGTGLTSYNKGELILSNNSSILVALASVNKSSSHGGYLAQFYSADSYSYTTYWNTSTVEISGGGSMNAGGYILGQGTLTISGGTGGYWSLSGSDIENVNEGNIRIKGDLIPSGEGKSLGTGYSRFKDLWLSGNQRNYGSVYIGGGVTYYAGDTNGDAKIRRLGLGGAVGGDTYTLTVTGSIYASGNVWALSDKNYKTNIQSLEDQLENINKVKVVSFDWIESGKSDIGVIAQELEKIYPSLVLTSEDGIKAVNYKGLSIMLLKAFQELNKI